MSDLDTHEVRLAHYWYRLYTAMPQSYGSIDSIDCLPGVEQAVQQGCRRLHNGRLLSSVAIHACAYSSVQQ